MPRDRSKVNGRLQIAAMELFRERGYEQTTATEIAARAGVTERTYFRHFADKRDILFVGEERLQTVLLTAIADAPVNVGLMATMEHVLTSVAHHLGNSDIFSRDRQAVISATPALREREASWRSAMMDAMAVALERKGFEAKMAMLAARVGGAIFVLALETWFEGKSIELTHSVDAAFKQLDTLCMK